MNEQTLSLPLGMQKPISQNDRIQQMQNKTQMPFPLALSRVCKCVSQMDMLHNDLLVFVTES